MTCSCTTVAATCWKHCHLRYRQQQTHTGYFLVRFKDVGFGKQMSVCANVVGGASLSPAAI